MFFWTSHFPNRYPTEFVKLTGHTFWFPKQRRCLINVIWTTVKWPCNFPPIKHWEQQNKWLIAIRQCSSLEQFSQALISEFIVCNIVGLNNCNIWEDRVQDEGKSFQREHEQLCITLSVLQTPALSAPISTNIFYLAPVTYQLRLAVINGAPYGYPLTLFSQSTF